MCLKLVNSLGEIEVHLLYKLACLVVTPHTDPDNTILEYLSLGKERAKAFADRRFADARDSFQCRQSVIQNADYHLLHVDLPTDEFLYFGYIQGEAWLLCLVLDLPSGVGPQYFALMFLTVLLPP